MMAALRCLWCLFRQAPAHLRTRFFRPRLERLEYRFAPAAFDTRATPIALTFAGNQQAQAGGDLLSANQVDLYAVALQAGDEVAVDVSTSAASSLQAALRIFDAGGRQLAFQENQSTGSDTVLTFDALATGTYYVGVSSNGNYSYDANSSNSGSGGLTAGSYNLTLDLSSILLPEGPSNFTLATAQSLVPDGLGNTVLQGTYVNGATEYYSFAANATGGWTATVTAVPAADGTVFLPRLTLYGASGQLLIQSDTASPGPPLAQLIQHLQPGTYYLAVSAVRDATSPADAAHYVLAGTFAAALPSARPLPVGSYPEPVAAADFNHDGNPDVAVGNFSDSDVSVLLGNGDGTFTPDPDTFAVGSEPFGLAVADFRNDGNLDIVTANYADSSTSIAAPGSVSVLLGNGDGSFQPAVSYPVGTGPEAVAVGDFNGDGYLDIVTANSNYDPATNTFGPVGTVSVLLGNGDGTFTPDRFHSPLLTAGTFAVGAAPYGVAVGDFNGQLGIVTGNFVDGTVSVLLGDGDGDFQPAATYQVGSGPYGVAVGNFNGHADIVTPNFYDNTVSVLLGNGKGAFTPDPFAPPGLPAGTFAVGVEPGAVAVGDFTGDGNLDIVATSTFGNSVSVLLGNGDGGFQAALTSNVGYRPIAVAVADFSQNGRLDLVTSNNYDDTVSVLMGLGDGTFVAASSTGVAVGQRPFGIAVADLNHDGNVDVVTANDGDNTVSVLLGNGDGTFQAAASYPVGAEPSDVAMGDFNGDGNLDIVTADSEDGTISVLLGRGDGTFLLPAATYSAGSSRPIAVAVGDFGNGHLDIVTADDVADGTVSVLLGNGAGTFLPPVTYAVGSYPRRVAVGDLGNGELDIVTANDGDNTVSVLLGKGNGAFMPDSFHSPGLADGTFAVGNVPLGVALGDFGNGHLDIVTADSNPNPDDNDNYDDPGTVTVLLGIGKGNFQPAVSYPVGRGPQAVAVGDFTGNGNLDIATVNYSDNTVSVLPGNGDATFQPAVAIPGGDSPYAVAVGDFTRDGNLGIVAANIGNNTVSVFLKNSQTSAFLPPFSYGLQGAPETVAVGEDNYFNPVTNTYNTDIATTSATANQVTVLLGDGYGSFQPAVNYSVQDSDGNGIDPTAVAFGYDDDDFGNTFLATANAGDNTVSVLEQSADSTFQTAVTCSVTDPSGNGIGPDAVAVGYDADDFNTFIVTANAGDDTVSVLEEQSDGTFGPAGLTTYTVGNRPTAVAVGTDNNDNTFIVTANAGDDTVSVLEEMPQGGFALAGTYPVGNDPVSVAVGNDGNGNTFIVTANAGDGTVSVLQQQADGSFGPALSYKLTSSPASVAVANDNGVLSIVTASTADHTVTVLQETTDGTFHTTGTYPVGAGPTSVAVASLKASDPLDIVTANAGNSTVSVWLSAAPFTPASPENDIATRNIPCMQDLTGDGSTDSLILDKDGALLFRRALPGAADQFAAPVIINPNNPARDATVFQTGSHSWAVAAVDDTGNVVSLYTWYPQLNQGQGGFQRSVGFATGNFPVRIAADDLTGNGLDDLVVGNDFDNSVTIALQTSPGQFTGTVTRPIGVGPSGIAFVNHPGQGGPDIVVSDQVSGDFTVLRNDGTATALPTFSQEYRYRAGSSLFDINIDPNTGDQTVQSQLQTIGIAAGDFTGTGSDELILLNRGAGGFTLFANQGQGSFANLQLGVAGLASAQPSQIAAVTLPGDTLPSVAVLMQAVGQIWLYRNDGHGHLAATPQVIDAGNDPSGFSVAQVNGQLALLVGNAYGDILTLLYDPSSGGFAPDRANLQNAPLAVGTIAGTGRQFAVVADQGTDRVALYYRVPGTDTFGQPIAIGGTSQLPLLAPGAVQTFSVPGDANPYLAVANSLSNNVLLYHYDPAAGQFALLDSLQVGDDPVSITVAHLTGSKVPDLLVANQGSNDISVLIGAVDPKTGLWTETPYQRLTSGGSGPIAVAVRNSGLAGGPNLLVTNSDGTVTRLPGIGSGGTGSGFFRDINPQTIALGQPILQSLLNSTTGQLFVVGGDGSVSVLSGDRFTTIVQLGVTTLGAFGADLVAGLTDGGVALYADNGTLLARANTGIVDALAVLQAGNDSLEVFATERGSDVPIIVTFAIPIVTELPRSLVTELPLAPAVAQAGQLPETELLLVATLLSGGLIETAAGTSTTTAPDADVFGALLPVALAPAEPLSAEGSQPRVPDGARPAAEGQPHAWRWQNFPAGVSEALQQRLQRPPVEDNVRPDQDEQLEPEVPEDSQPSATRPQPPEDAVAEVVEEASGAPVTAKPDGAENAGPTGTLDSVAGVAAYLAGAALVVGEACGTRLRVSGSPRRPANPQTGAAG